LLVARRRRHAGDVFGGDVLVAATDPTCARIVTG
jgi:hypothetical protein